MTPEAIPKEHRRREGRIKPTAHNGRAVVMIWGGAATMKKSSPITLAIATIGNRNQSPEVVRFKMKETLASKLIEIEASVPFQPQH
mmetsp:Transcript_7597/g.18947  ORF Transcript_7597/g.18947 Transcript_7597/m.18947 type:complete len:86 (+) Transcript_7597:2882-3139(+)